MREIRRADADRIDVLAHLVEHLAEILEARDIGKHLEDGLGVRRAHVGVAKGDDVGEAGVVEFLDDLGTAVADAEAGEIDLFTGGLGSGGLGPAGLGAEGEVGCENRRGAGGEGTFDEGAPWDK